MHNSWASIKHWLDYHAGQRFLMGCECRQDLLQVVAQPPLVHDPIFLITDHNNAVVRAQVNFHRCVIAGLAALDRCWRQHCGRLFKTPAPRLIENSPRSGAQ
jgi:hypothetical protein